MFCYHLIAQISMLFTISGIGNMNLGTRLGACCLQSPTLFVYFLICDL